MESEIDSSVHLERAMQDVFEMEAKEFQDIQGRAVLHGEQLNELVDNNCNIDVLNACSDTSKDWSVIA